MSVMAPNDTALIVVDVQNDFCDGGNLAVAGGSSIIPAINGLTDKFNCVVFTQDWHPAGHSSFASSHAGKKPFVDTIEMPYGTQALWTDHCVQGTSGADFHDDLAPVPTKVVLQKGTNPDVDSYSGFFENDKVSQPRFDDGRTLTQFLKDKGIKRVVLVGLAFDFCVGYHGLDARKEGFEAIVVKDATKSIGIPLDEDKTTETVMETELKAAGAQVIPAHYLPRALGIA